MEYTQLINTRYSVRSFAPQPIEAEKLQQILEAGRLAPTARNLQPQRIYVLQSQQSIEKIRDITRCAFNAPVVLLVCGDLNSSWISPFTSAHSTVMDASIVCTFMMMRAQDLGLGSTWVCLFDPNKVKEAFDLPEGIEPCCLLTLGYPAADATPGPNHALRKPLEETVTYL
nr:nitroreductase family protein [bacterium]